MSRDVFSVRSVGIEFKIKNLPANGSYRPVIIDDAALRYGVQGASRTARKSVAIPSLVGSPCHGVLLFDGFL
jgi:hypothetical protein